MSWIFHLGLLCFLGFNHFLAKSHVISDCTHGTSLVSRAEETKMHPVVKPETPHLKDLPKYLPKTNYTAKKWKVNLVPYKCLRRLPKEYHDVDVDVFDVFYEDCDRPWVLCRHTSAQLAAKDMMDNIGQLPVQLRSYTRHWLALPDPTNGVHAYSLDDDVVLYGNIRHATVYVHEVSAACS